MSNAERERAEALQATVDALTFNSLVPSARKAYAEMGDSSLPFFERVLDGHRI